jgi:hypothetical protein
VASDKVQAIRDRTEAQSLVTKTLAGAAAELVKNDPALVKRAAEAFIAKEIGHQHNRETIAFKAIEHLKETPDAQTAKPDDDWLNVFARHAQEASSERMQDFWSKILAGQLRRANSFSLQTLRFASELDESTAALFEKWSSHVISGSVIAFPPNVGPQFVELIQLEDFGLFTGVVAPLSNAIDDKQIPDTGPFSIIFNFRSHNVVVRIRKPFSMNYRSAILTRIGRELFPITKTPSTMEIVRAFVNDLPKDNVVHITALSTATQPPLQELIWKEQKVQH